MGALIRDILPFGVFAFLLVFARVGSLIMMLPGIGEQYVSVSIRLTLAMAISFVLMLPLAPSLPNAPTEVPRLIWMIFSEVGIGVFIGLSVRILMSALSIAGNVIGMQTGLSFAQFYDPAQASQSALVSAFLSIFGLFFVFTADLHLMMLRAVADSYQLFSPVRMLPPGEFAQLAARAVAESWFLGIQFSAPFIIYGMVFAAGQGVLSRLMPQIQITYITQPVQILGGLFVLASTLGLVGTYFVAHLEDHLSHFLVR